MIKERDTRTKIIQSSNRDRLYIPEKVAACCGQIHPTGSGYLVAYQNFEYAVGHWLQKTAEHVLGCVLCSPGCFSLMRISYLGMTNVMAMYKSLGRFSI